MEKTFLISEGPLTILCKENVPDHGELRRIVLSVHGIGGSTDDDIQRSIAEEMEFFSSAVFRFDFPAHGESPLDSDFLTLPNCMNSLLAVARYARERYPEVEDLCIFASGFGAYITLVCLDQLLDMPGKVKLVVQTPSVRMHETLLAIKHITEPTLRAMEHVTFRASRPFEVTYRFYEELRENFALTSYDIPMLILHGEEDSVIRKEDIQHFRRINDQAKLVIIPGTSHRFLEDGAWDMVLDLTRDWFEFEQVLVTDWE
ncbi:MAG: alpha/beta hydrolase [Oscillospiraceae bacterium]|nr:alpha/beta hydrolase [Oscillospiraceae bacterium]